MRFELVNIWIGHPRYEELLGQIRSDTKLRRQMRRDADHDLGEKTGKVWSMALAMSGGRWVPAAWAAAQVVRGVLVCSDNYERRGFRGPDLGRVGWGLYPEAYAFRHATVVARVGLPARTFVFAQPLALHEADGWAFTGLTGVSTTTRARHGWWELRRLPNPDTGVVAYPSKALVSLVS